MLLDVQRRGAADQQLPEQSLYRPTRDASVRPAPKGREQRDERKQQLSLSRAYGRPGEASARQDGNGPTRPWPWTRRRGPEANMGVFGCLGSSGLHRMKDPG